MFYPQWKLLNTVIYQTSPWQRETKIHRKNRNPKQNHCQFHQESTSFRTKNNTHRLIMAPPDAQATELLTEHLGFPPIALIDDIINAVNGVMYKCTQAVETYLRQKAQKEQYPDDSIVLTQSQTPGVLSGEEIEIGVAKLETLLENAVDKNFDKFELYALRNILTIPNDLTSGYLKLKHNEGVALDKESESKSVKLDLKINQLFKDITNQIYLKKTLLLQIKKSKKLVRLLNVYKDSLQFLSTESNNPSLSKEAQVVLNSITPLNETFYYLVAQSLELFKELQDTDRFLSDNTSKLSNFDKTRDDYLNVETLKLLKVLNLANDKPKITKVLNGLSNVDFSNEELKAKLQENFGISTNL